MVTRRSVLGLGSGAFLLLAGCSAEQGGDASPTPSGPGSATPTPGGTPTPTESPSPSPSAVEPVTDLDATDLVTGLTSPWGLAFFRDGTALLTERDTGRILHLVDGEVTEVGRIEDVVPSSEGGTLGVAITPDEKTVFVYYSRADDNRLVSMPWNGSRVGEQKVLLGGVPLAQTHNGGQLLITPDEHLFVSTGDARAPEESQYTDSLAGKILRLTLDGKPAGDNPFDNEVWTYGHRNVQGLALDDHGRLWASEFGDQTTDELNVIIAGENYGWPIVEGTGDVDRYRNPKATWTTDQASPSGLAWWQGSLWMAGLRGERLWQITPSDDSDDPEVDDPKDWFAGEYGRLRAVRSAPDGETLYLGTSNTDGRGSPADRDDRILALTRTD